MVELGEQQAPGALLIDGAGEHDGHTAALSPPPSRPSRAARRRGGGPGLLARGQGADQVDQGQPQAMLASGSPLTLLSWCGTAASRAAGQQRWSWGLQSGAVVVGSPGEGKGLQPRLPRNPRDERKARLGSVASLGPARAGLGVHQLCQGVGALFLWG